ncbi:hypothetical protein [Sinomonas sp. ASV322]|uniref:hypothetical protein n=1 Tax=Sinomonas sp. ASV322 TaxID=3041920 RepID=UPI0027DDDA6A|nr:hypothetical protein [Sinomonas sp. ASV322]MDQ4503034.1 hypothetical protein [Sinomonas sp. ASV322]
MAAARGQVKLLEMLGEPIPDDVRRPAEYRDETIEDVERRQKSDATEIHSAGARGSLRILKKRGGVWRRIP